MNHHLCVIIWQLARAYKNRQAYHPLGEGRDPAAFLVAQVGAHAASKFGERLKKLHLSRPQSGILWNLSSRASITQRELAARLRVVPSRLVALLDELESKGLIERRRNLNDRRRHSLHLKEKGRATLKLIAEISRDHQEELLAALSQEEQKRLSELLQRIADEQGLTRGVHPGFSRL